MVKEGKFTSVSVSGLAHKLAELVLFVEGGDLIVWSSLRTHIKITDDECCFLKVDELFQQM